MPIYEFTCAACGHEFDQLVFSHDTFEMKCPKCQSPDVVKKMSAANHSMGGGVSASAGPGGVTHNQCSSGSCATIDIPGPKG